MADPTTQPIDEPNVWLSTELPGRGGWSHELTPDMIGEIEHAMGAVVADGRARTVGAHP